MSEIRYDGQVVVVTGAGGGLGAAYSRFFGSRGASVVVNDLGGSFKGEGGASTRAADCARAAWPHFRKQKYGRVINTASAAGLFGSFGQTNYSAAKLALVGFTETLAKEGAKYNIKVNVIAPIAASRMTETVMPPDMLANLKPEWVVPLVATLVDKDAEESGSIFEVGGGHVAKLRWERSSGALLKADDSYTAGALLAKWDDVNNFKEAEYPSGPADFLSLLDKSMKLPSAPKAEALDFSGKVVLITGAGAGIGRAYALAFAKLGAKLVINDLVNPDTAPCENGEEVVKGAIDAFGRIDVVVNNAGILRDKAFANMDDKLWDPVMDVHLRGTYKVTKAAWPYFLKQKYGRVINTTSTSGIYGNFGQANYAAAKCGILGFSRALAREGAKYNIYVNTIAPNAGTAMTRTIMPEEMVQAFKPDYIAPLGRRARERQDPQPNRWPLRGRLRLGRQHPLAAYRRGDVPVDVVVHPEAVRAEWARIVNFDDGRADQPDRRADGLKSIMANMENKSSNKPRSPPASPSPTPRSSPASTRAKKAKATGTEFTYEERDVSLYNLGIGALRTELPYIFEGSHDLPALPTFGVIPPFSAEAPFDISAIVPNFNPMMLLHGEQYLEIRQFPIPTSATLVSYPQLIEVVDKGSAAVLKSATTTVDKATGKDVFYNEQIVLLRGAGGCGGNPKAGDRARATDGVVKAKTTEEQAAVYRLSGDYNPLHVDPEFAAMGGFKEPILHGLCFFGIAGKAVYKTYGAFKNIKVRFAGTVTPGQTLVTEMWKDGNKVIFQTKVKETGKLALASAAVELA
ncbi:hypothetical protein VE04_06526 [Pseudogymnoascus sp. 24MN13]|nr:hypothetical protein VE04_06526 [Pseudogymnoascus sp. 24MN13]